MRETTENNDGQISNQIALDLLITAGEHLQRHIPSVHEITGQLIHFVVRQWIFLGFTLLGAHEQPWMLVVVVV